MKNEKVIFLDVDGVLNKHIQHPTLLYCSIEKDCAQLLNSVFFKTDAKIVLTSAWRYNVHGGSMNLEGLKNLFYSHWVDASRLIGITRKDISNTKTDRGQQITDWIKSNFVPSSYVVVDDMDLDISVENHPFVQTDGKIGLTQANCNEIIQILTMGESSWAKNGAEPCSKAIVPSS